MKNGSRATSNCSDPSGTTEEDANRATVATESARQPPWPFASVPERVRGSGVRQSVNVHVFEESVYNFHNTAYHKDTVSESALERDVRNTTYRNTA